VRWDERERERERENVRLFATPATDVPISFFQQQTTKWEAKISTTVKKIWSLKFKDKSFNWKNQKKTLKLDILIKEVIHLKIQYVKLSLTVSVLYPETYWKKINFKVDLKGHL